MTFFAFVRTRLFWQHIFLSTSMVVIISWIILCSLKFYTSPGDKVKVPDFRGIAVTELDKFAGEKGVDYMIIDSIFDPKGQKGIVIGQDPQPNAMAKEGRTIYVTVSSTRPQLVKLPNLIDLSLKTAAATLETYGLKQGRIRYLDGLPVVLRMQFNGADIKAGTMIEKGSVVELYVGRGLAGGDGRVPDLNGLTKEEAINILQSKGLTPGAVIFDGTFLTSADSAAAIVFKQSPTMGDSLQLKPGAFIDIYLRKPVDQPVLDSTNTDNEFDPNK